MSKRNPTLAISMPIDVFVNAVHLAGEPCQIGCADWNKTEHPAVRQITDWWNSVAPAFRFAHSFTFYVRCCDDWLSSNPEEGWVSAKDWAKNPKHGAEATLLGGKVIFVFYTRSVDEDVYSFNAKAVDGSHGCSGGKWPETSGDAILTYDSYKALSLVPVRFPEIWNEVKAGDCK